MDKLLRIAFAAMLLAPLTGTSAAQILIERHQPLRLQAPDIQRAAETKTITLGGVSYALQLWQNEALLLALTAGERSALKSGGYRYYDGEIVDEPDSWARLAWLRGAWQGMVHVDGETFLIDRRQDVQGMLRGAAEVTDGQDGKGSVAFMARDLLFLDPIDHGGAPVPGLSDYSTAAVPNGKQVLDLLGEVIASHQAMPLTIVADRRFAATHGNDTTAVIVSRLNMIDGIYSNQVGVGLQLHELAVLTDNENMVSTEAMQLLGEFKDYMTNGGGSGIPREGLGHLLTGRVLNGNTGGIAYMAVMCSDTFGFGLSRTVTSDTTSALLMAHELGHNFGAPHDRQAGSVCEDSNIAGIMNPVINGSQQFSNCSLERMADDVARASCLVPVADTLFQDDFEPGG